MFAALVRALQAWAQSVLQLHPRNPDFVLGETAAELIRDLWAHPAVRATFEHSTELQLNDSAEYYFDNVMRLGVANYLPSDQDILRSRVMTTDVVETTFVTGGVPYRCVGRGSLFSACLARVLTVLNRTRVLRTLGRLQGGRRWRSAQRAPQVGEVLRERDRHTILRGALGLRHDPA